MNLDYDFSMKHAGPSDVEKFILSTDEFKLVSARILALGTTEPVEFFIERENYTFDVFVKKSGDQLKNNYISEYEFNIKLIVDIKLFDTTKKVYLPAPLSEIEVIGNTVDTIFETERIGGLFVTDSQEIIIEPFAFSNIKIIESPMLVSFKDKNGNSLGNKIFKNCDINKVRHIYSYNDYMEFLQNNKVDRINNLHLEYKFYDLLEDENLLKEQLSLIKNVKNLTISVLFIRGKLIDFNFKNYQSDVLNIIKQFKLCDSSGIESVSVSFIPGIIMNKFVFPDEEKLKLKQLVYNNSDKKYQFGLYIS